MFSALNESEKLVIVNAMQSANFQAGQVVIKEGDEGDCLYVVEAGQLECTKFLKKTDAKPTKLKTYKSGDAFGELALLYNAPRAATITATSACKLWKLDRQTFNHIVKDAAAKKREHYEKFLAKVKIL